MVMDVVQSRLEFATKFGADGTYKMENRSPEANAHSLLSKANLQDDKGVDIVVDATGAEPCISCGITALKRGGIFVQAGLGSPVIPFAIGQICDKEATLKGSSRYGPGDYKLAIQLLDAGRVQLGSLITHDFPFTEAEQAFQNVRNRAGIKTIIYGPGVVRSLADSTAADRS